MAPGHRDAMVLIVSLPGTKTKRHHNATALSITTITAAAAAAAAITTTTTTTAPGTAATDAITHNWHARTTQSIA